MENLGTPSRKPPAFRRPAILLDEAEKHSDSSSSDCPDGVLFRKPMAPVQMTISPGNAANEGKLAEKLKKLELSRKKTTRAQPIDLKTPSKIDLVATERFFVESSVENIAQTPRNQSIREPFRNAQFSHNLPHNSFSMGTPRDSMRSNATYVLTTPKVDRALHPHNDPFTPSVVTPSLKQNTVTTPLAYDEKLERQFVALSSWANVILDSASFVSEIDLGTSKQDASRKLQEMLTAKPSKKNGVTTEGMKGRYTDLCLRKKCLDYLKRADSVYQSILIPGKLKTMVEKGEISIKPNIEVYANIGVQTSILSLLFSLHPFWLFIGVETVCAEFSDHDTSSLDARLPFSSSSFAPATVRFIHDNILANAKLMSKKKFAIGTVKKLVTEKGREVLHKHCITCILNIAVLLEYAKNSYLFENTPGLFVKNSEIKTVTDFCTELSRLVLSASGTPLNKAFDKTSFRRSYRQSFLEEYQYVMKSMRDMADGIILGRLIELLTDSSPLSIIGNMRNPQGDRIRKKGNVEKALSAAAEAGIDVDGISIDQILSAHRESCLDLMWRLVGVYVKKRAEQEPLRRESLCLEGGTDTEEDGDYTVMGAPLGGMAESAYSVYQQLAFQFGLSLSKWADLEDGLLLSSIWQHYNSTAPDVRFYDGDNLFEKVANAAESDLGIPLALTALRDERQLGLFAHMFLSRLISYKRLRDSEMSDAESDASSIVSIIRKEGVNLSEETNRIQRVRLESERAVSAREEEERLKREEEKRREEELRKRFEEEEEERLTSEWRSPPSSSESIEREERMLMEKGEEERIEEELRRAEEKQREEDARIEAERLKKEEEERMAEEKRMRDEEEENERVRMEKERKEEEERIRREEAVRLEEERKKREEEEERERMRLEQEERLKEEEEERKRIEEEEERKRIEEVEERKRIEEEEERKRIEEEEERKRIEEEEERKRIEEEARLKAEEEERMRREEEERLRAIEETRLREEEEERERRKKEEEERRERAAITIQCWTRGVTAVRLLNGLRERLQKEEEERREKASIKIASWICDRFAIRAAKKELEERRQKKEEEEREMERLRMEEEMRRKREKDAVERIEIWYSSLLSIRVARHLLMKMREEKWKREEEERLERERLAREAEERVMREEEERLERKRMEEEERERDEEARRLFVLKETAACKIQNHYRGWRRIVRAKEELERRKEEKREEMRRLREEEERLERERMAREEEERLMREEEQRLIREENERVEREMMVREEEERLKREEEEKFKREEEQRLIREEEERLERERLAREEEERLKKEEEEEERLIREEKERLERERQLKEEMEKERLRREEEIRMEMEVKRKEEERRREEEELKEWAAKQLRAKEKEEAIYQEMLAAQERSRRVDEMRENRAARVIQSSMRSWLQKKKTERRTMELLESMEGERGEGRSNQRMTIGGVSDDRLLAGVREIKRRQRKLSLTLYRMTSISTVTAATRIQAWWRGILTRRRERVKIELIGVRMKEYNQKANEAMEGDAVERAIPVSRRLERARKSLENPLRLYDIKVACYTTMSLCRLSSLYCERAIVLDLPALLINMFNIQADRSPAFEEIIEFGVQAIEEMVKCTTPRVRAEMIEEGANVVKLMNHWMLAFHSHRLIPARAMMVLRLCKEILPVESHAEIFEKMHTYYLKKGEEKFGKLQAKDCKNKEFLLLKKAFAK